MATIGVPTIFFGICALACPVGMGVMMWIMMRGRRDQPAHRVDRDDPSAVSVRQEGD